MEHRDIKTLLYSQFESLGKEEAKTKQVLAEAQEQVKRLQDDLVRIDGGRRVVMHFMQAIARPAEEMPTNGVQAVEEAVSKCDEAAPASKDAIPEAIQRRLAAQAWDKAENGDSSGAAPGAVGG